ncbi:hypothetical protein T069G_02558 [Trichoderma breve]|uniref:Amidase n=1 Tax=Trichoderma breve TaxID=2034170 RepID=A0A9W9E857_9HYPO|nr:hypothetical protein T069G_02558 [Trichoderma breve]KAJ4861604.1 hypothetical protein T069G_02558 [Trichoderma breve]
MDTNPDLSSIELPRSVEEEVKQFLNGDQNQPAFDQVTHLLFLYEKGNYDEARKILVGGLDACKKLKLESESDEIDVIHAHMLNTSAILDDCGGYFDSQIEKLKEVLEIWKRVLGEYHEEISGVLNNLCLAYESAMQFQTSLGGPYLVTLYSDIVTQEALPAVPQFLLRPVSLHGLLGLGGMAKTAQDLAALTEILFLTVPGSPMAGKSLIADFSSSLDGLRLGFVEPNDWMFSSTILEPDETYLQQRRDHWNHAMNELNRLGAKIICPIKIKKTSEYTFEGKSSYQVIRYGGWKRIVADYLDNLAESKVHSLEDIVEFSKQNPDLEFSDVCPNQDSLLNVLKYDIPASVVDDAVRDVRQAAGPEGIDRVLKEYCIDAIIAPTDSDIHKLASFSGYPMGTMPLGYLLPIGRPHGLSIFTSKYNDSLILRIMHVYGTKSFTRKIPSQLEANSVGKVCI